MCCQEHGLVFVSDDTLAADAAAAAAPAAESSSEPEASSVKKSNPHPPAALLSTDILDILQAYSGTLGQLVSSLEITVPI